MEFGFSCLIAGVQGLEAESGGFEFRRNGNIQQTTDSKTALDGVESALPLGDTGIRAESVFEKDELPIGAKDPEDLGKGPGAIRQTAQHVGGDDGVEGIIREWQGIGADALDVEIDPAFHLFKLQFLEHSGARINRGDALDVFRVMRKIEACADADFQNSTTDRIQNAGARTPERGHAHERVIDGWEEAVAVECHVEERWWAGWRTSGTMLHHISKLEH